MRRAARAGWVLALVSGVAVVSGASASAAPERPALPLTGLAIAAGDGYNCAVLPEGAVDCWGEPYWDSGQVADQAAGNSPFIQVDAAGEHSCGVRADGSVDCWGDNWNGRATDQAASAPNDRFAEVSVAFAHTCGLRTVGDIWCWGQPFEDLGHPGDYFYGRPMSLDEMVGQGLPDYADLSSGGGHTCAVQQVAGSIDCWGENGNGQATAPPVDGDPFVQVAAGDSHTCGLRADGSVDCWGSQAQDQPAGESRFTQVTAGDDFTCALREDRTVGCWGDAVWLPSVDYPPDNQGFLQISAGGGHVCGIRQSGDVLCWGFSAGGQADPQPGPYAGYEAELATLTAKPGPEPTTPGAAREVDVEVVDQAGYAMPDRKVRSSAGGSVPTDHNGVAHFSQTAGSAYYYVDVDGLPGFDAAAGDLRTDDVVRAPGAIATLELSDVDGSQPSAPLTAGDISSMRVCAINSQGDPLPGEVLNAVAAHTFFVDDQGTSQGDEVSVVTDETGCADLEASIGRDVGFDDDGLVQSLIRVFGDGERASVDLHWTSEDPLAGGSVTLISPASRTVGEQAGLIVAVTDGYGNRVGGETVALASSGVGSTSARSVVTDYDNEADATASTQSAGSQTVSASWSSPSGARSDSTQVEWGRLRIQATLSGVGNGKRSDVLTVNAPGSAAGAPVRLFKITATGRKLLRTEVLGAAGDLTVTQKDGNGRRFIKYVAVVMPTSSTDGVTTNEVKLR